MKNLYSWYLRPSDEYFKEIWSKAILTVDANVLLDLYRYNETTRDDLMKSLERFHGRIWLSHQASEEFIRNRFKAIVSVSKSFEEAIGEVINLCNALDTAVVRLKGNRIVPQAVTDALRKSVEESVTEAKTQIEHARDLYPDYLGDDPILTRILKLFEGVVGDSFNDSEIEEVLKEAQRRIDSKIPPGYLDNSKDGERKYGDYFLWRQILEYAKAKCKPIIFVTSERKNDWWEEYSGRTVGPRMELLRESMNYTGQKVLIYKTERFVSHAAQYIGAVVEKGTVEDILAVSESRFGNAVEIILQTITNASERANSGTLLVRLLRPVYKFTCSGHLDPKMVAPPSVWVKLLQAPDNLPSYKLGGGTGTDFDFNAHIRSTEYGACLPIGDYVFEYSAFCPQSTDQSEQKNT